MKNKFAFIRSVALILFTAVCFSLLVSCHDDTPKILSKHTVYKAEYPNMAKYPEGRGSLSYEKSYDNWKASKQRQSQYYGMGNGLYSFYTKSISAFLSDSGNENRVYSPVNVYMALAMLAEITDGESRSQILSLLGTNSIDALRNQAFGVWNANYSNDGAVTSILANSLWLNEDFSFNDQTLETLANSYYASSFIGEMGSDKFNKALRVWIDEQTGGLLKNYTSNIELSPETLIALASTVYFQAKWESEFTPEKTKSGVFHSPDGDLTAEFMHTTDIYGKYYYGENFSATSMALEGSGNMLLVLPDENVSVNELLSDSESLGFITSNGKWENKTTIKVNLALPKFDVSSSTDLVAKLKSLGVTDCFDSQKANFSPLLSKNNNAFVSSVDHSVRVTVDEEGVSAAAYTVIPVCGCPMPPENEIDFILDRPFIFVLTGDDGTPMFVGVVNNL